MSGSLGEALPAEIKRCQELVQVYRELPNGAGAFGAMMIQRDIDAAVRALASGDIIAMISAHRALQESK